MDKREQAGKELFEAGLIEDKNSHYEIKGKAYKITKDACTCPDYFSRSRDTGCKHIWAIRYYIKSHGEQTNTNSNPILISEEVKPLIEFMNKKGCVVKEELIFQTFKEQIIEKALNQNIIIKSGREYVLMV